MSDNFSEKITGSLGLVIPDPQNNLSFAKTYYQNLHLMDWVNGVLLAGCRVLSANYSGDGNGGSLTGIKIQFASGTIRTYFDINDISIPEERTIWYADESTLDDELVDQHGNIQTLTLPEYEEFNLDVRRQVPLIHAGKYTPSGGGSSQGFSRTIFPLFRNSPTDDLLENADETLKAMDNALQQMDIHLQEARELADENLQDQVNDLKDKDTNLQDQVDDLKDKDINLQDQVDDLKDKDINLQDQVDDLKDKDINLQDQVDDLKDKDINLQDQVDDLKDKDINLQDQVDDLKDKDINLQGQVDDLKDKDINLQDQVDDLKDKDTELEGQLTTAKEDISELFAYRGSYLAEEWIYPTNTVSEEQGFFWNEDKNGYINNQDGKKYYYTQRKGAKPILSPAKGGFMGSVDRIMFRSLELVEDQTGLNGEPVYSVNGLDWIFLIGHPMKDGKVAPRIFNDDNGLGLFHQEAITERKLKLEVVGFFNQAVLLLKQTDGNLQDDEDADNVYINGKNMFHNGNPNGKVLAKSTVSPLAGRDLPANIQVPLNFIGELPTLLGVNTLTVEQNSENSVFRYLSGIELFADTNEIRIPQQQVVISGKIVEIAGQSLGYKPPVNFDPGDSNPLIPDYDLGAEVWEGNPPQNGGGLLGLLTPPIIKSNPQPLGCPSTRDLTQRLAACIKNHRIKRKIIELHSSQGHWIWILKSMFAVFIFESLAMVFPPDSIHWARV